MTIAIEASSPAFMYYESGVLSKRDRCGNNLNHAVVLVGYTDVSEDTHDDRVGPVDPANPIGTICTVDKWWHKCKVDSRRQL